MDLDKKQIKGKPKKIGHIGNKPVYSLMTKGGLHVIVKPTSTGFETLGAGSHGALARHIAQKNEPEVSWSELSKADHCTLESFQLVLPKYEALTEALRAAGKIEDGT